MAYLYPYGDTQQLNLDWLIEQWNEVKSQIDGSLQAEIDRVEAAITDLLTARDEAVAAQTAAQASAQAAAGSASTASGAASTATAQAQAAAGSAATAGAHASDAQGYAATAQQEAQAANNSAGAAAISANTANGAKQDAQTYAQQAAGSAQNAQGSAVAAQQQFNLADAARVAAQDAASDAADSAQDAQDILDSIPEDYSDLSNDVSELQTALPLAVNKLGKDNRIFIKQLVFTNGYWNTSGNVVDSTTTFHVDKINVIANNPYYVEFPDTTTKIIMRNFNQDGTVQSSDERTTSGIFTPTTSIIAFNAIGNAKNDEIYFYDANSNLVQKNNAYIFRGLIASGTIALSDYKENGWYVVYGAVTVTDRPSAYPSGGFYLYVNTMPSQPGRLPSTQQIIYPYNSDMWAYRVIGSDWIVPSNKKYSGKTISIIGDSISDKSNSTAATRYYDIIDADLGTTSTEYAMSGCGYARKYNNGDTFYEQAAKIATDTDLVLIFGSFNDHNVYDNDGLGNVTDTTTSSVFGCVNYTLQTIFTRAPKAQVGIILPMPWAEFPPYTTETLEWEYIDGIKTIAEMYSIPVLNMYTESNMRPWDSTFRTNFYNEDGVQDVGTHPSSKGHKRIAPRIEAFVVSILEQG